MDENNTLHNMLFMKGGLYLILEGMVWRAQRVLFVFPLREVVKLMLLHLLKAGSYMHYPVVNNFLLELILHSGVLWCVAHSWFELMVQIYFFTYI